LIVFEGVDGRGKKAQVELAREFLKKDGYDVLVTEEPGGTGLGQRLRLILGAAEGEPIDNRAEALIFAAGRAQHVARVLRPALEEGKVVLCDGYVDSSLAYDGAGRGLSEQDVLSLNVWATQGLVPDLAILLHRNPDRRLEGPTDKRNAENEALELQPAVADAFLRIAEDHPERFVIIDADARPDLVHGRVREALTGYLRRGMDREAVTPVAGRPSARAAPSEAMVRRMIRRRPPSTIGRIRPESGTEGSARAPVRQRGGGT
jgi:dTMP kinase